MGLGQEQLADGLTVVGGQTALHVAQRAGDQAKRALGGAGAHLFGHHEHGDPRHDH